MVWVQDMPPPWIITDSILRREQTGALSYVLGFLGGELGLTCSTSLDQQGEWFDQHLKRHGGLICPLDPVRKSVSHFFHVSITSCK